MTAMTKKAVLASTVSMMALAGCAQAPQATNPGTPRPQDQPIVINDPSQLKPAGGAVANVPPPVDTGYWNFDCRFIAFEAFMKTGEIDHNKYDSDKDVPNTTIGNLFLYDEVLKDVYVLNGAIAGLDPSYGYGHVSPEGLDSGSELFELNPYAFADGRILFEFDGEIFYYDIYSEERVTVAFDGRKGKFGGSHPAVTGDGAAIAYINRDGLVVLKLMDGDFYTKTRVLTKIAAEAQFLADEGKKGIIYDIDISDDAKWLVANIDGLLYLYDIVNPHLFQLLPLGGYELGGARGNIGHVAISFDGRLIAFTVDGDNSSGDKWKRHDERLLVLDRATGYIDTVPYANLGDIDTDDFVADPIFCGNQLLFETKIGNFWKVWKYDLDTELLRALVILNNVLGDVGANVSVSDPKL